MEGWCGVGYWSVGGYVEVFWGDKGRWKLMWVLVLWVGCIYSLFFSCLMVVCDRVRLMFMFLVLLLLKSVLGSIVWCVLKLWL